MAGDGQYDYFRLVGQPDKTWPDDDGTLIHNTLLMLCLLVDEVVNKVPALWAKDLHDALGAFKDAMDTKTYSGYQPAVEALVDACRTNSLHKWKTEQTG